MNLTGTQDMQDTQDTRVQRLLDVQAVLDLKHRYAELCDTGFDPELIGGLFAPGHQVAWRSNSFGNHEGHDAVRAFFADVRSQITWAAHYMTNPTVRIHDDGHTATGTWTLLELATMPTHERPDGESVLMTGRYQDSFVRIGGHWYFTEIRIQFDRRTTLTQPLSLCPATG